MFVKKKGGSKRSCTNYRERNKVTVKNKNSLLKIDDLFDQLEGTTMFSKSNLWSTYHQLRIKESDIPKTSFCSRYGHYEFTVKSFELKNSLAIIVELLNKVLKDFLDTFVGIYWWHLGVLQDRDKTWEASTNSFLKLFKQTSCMQHFLSVSFGWSRCVFLAMWHLEIEFLRT